MTVDPEGCCEKHPTVLLSERPGNWGPDYYCSVCDGEQSRATKAFIKALTAERERYQAEASDRQREIGRLEAERDTLRQSTSKMSVMLAHTADERDALKAALVELVRLEAYDEVPREEWDDEALAWANARRLLGMER